MDSGCAVVMYCRTGVPAPRRSVGGENNVCCCIVLCCADGYRVRAGEFVTEAGFDKDKGRNVGLC